MSLYLKYICLYFIFIFPVGKALKDFSFKIKHLFADYLQLLKRV